MSDYITRSRYIKCEVAQQSVPWQLPPDECVKRSEALRTVSDSYES